MGGPREHKRVKKAWEEMKINERTELDLSNMKYNRRVLLLDNGKSHV